LTSGATTRHSNHLSYTHHSYLARLQGFEPGTYGLEVRCSIQLSYRRIIILHSNRRRLMVITPLDNFVKLNADELNKSQILCLYSIEWSQQLFIITGFPPLRLCRNYFFVIPCKRSATLSLPRIPASARTGPIRGNPVYIHGSPLSRGRRLDAGACPGPRSGIRRHDGLDGAFYYYGTVSSRE
jgi:hypothetical protein